MEPIRAQHRQSLNQQVVDRLELFNPSLIMQQVCPGTRAKSSQAWLNNNSVPK
jgi:hypothetical protein